MRWEGTPEHGHNGDENTNPVVTAAGWVAVALLWFVIGYIIANIGRVMVGG